MSKNRDIENEIEKRYSIRKEFKDICRESFNDPSEEFTEALFDVVPDSIIGNELKKIKGMKVKKGKYYMVEKIKKV